MAYFHTAHENQEWFFPQFLSGYKRKKEKYAKYAHKVPNIDYLDLYRKCLPTPALDLHYGLTL